MQKIFLGIPVLNRFDLLEQCLSSFDYSPIELFIVNNNTVDSSLNEHLGRLQHQYHFDTFSPRYNLGVAASWNRIITTAWSRGYDFVYIGSNDIILSPGSLKLFINMDKPQPECLWMLNRFNFWCLRISSISTVGLFDENFMPAYFEDDDYDYRIKLAGLQSVSLCDQEIQYNGRTLPAVPSTHLGSQTINSNPDYKNKNSYTFEKWNKNHYIMKWGGIPGQEKFTTPYNDSNRSISWWPDPAGSVALRDWDTMQ